MKTTNFNSIEEIYNSKSECKSVLYLEISQHFVKKSKEIAENYPNSVIMQNALKEVIDSFRKCESSDCEFTSYRNALAAEIWLNKMITKRFWS